MDKLNFIYEGGASKRFHTCRTLTTQDIAAHSFGVAWLCELITGGEASKNLIMAALSHDLAEHLVGDIPSPAKRAMQIGKLFNEYEHKHLTDVGLNHYEDGLTTIEHFVFKLADNMDGLLFCLKERRLGNKNLDVVFSRFHSYTEELLYTFPTNNYLENARGILNFITLAWKEEIL